MILIFALMFYASCIGAFLFSVLSPGPDNSLLTVISLAAIFNTGLLAEGIMDMGHTLGRYANRWRDKDAPPDWHNLLMARDLAADWYHRRYMSPMPGGLRRVLEWGLLASGFGVWLALVFRLGVYPLMENKPTADMQEIFFWTGVAVFATYGAWFVIDACWHFDRQRQDAETADRLSALMGTITPRLAVADGVPRKRDIGDIVMCAVLELMSATGSVDEPWTFSAMGRRYFVDCPIYTGPTAKPARMLRDVFSKFGWFWLIGVVALVLGWFVPGTKAMGWAPHLFRMLAWTGTAAYAYFLYLATKSMAIRAQAEWPQGYSPCEFAPLRRLLEEAATLRDSGRLEYGRDFPETPVR